MGEICLGFGASHSPLLFVTPDKWLARIHREPLANEPKSFRLTPENIQKTRMQVQRCHEAYRELHRLLMKTKPDALVIIGDDQGENFNTSNMAPFVIYSGDEVEGTFSLGRRLPREEQEDLRQVKVRCDAVLAKQILHEFMNADFDVAFSETLPGEGLGHAHMWPLKFLTPELDLPIIPVFINAYFPPQPRPSRCYLLGKIIAQAIRKTNKRVAIMGSGGLSHFPRHLEAWGIPPYPSEKRWYIDEAFDRHALDSMILGNGQHLAELTSDDLQRTGNLELRNWIALMGALGQCKGQLLAYEPIHTVAIGLAFSAWT